MTYRNDDVVAGATYVAIKDEPVQRSCVYGDAGADARRADTPSFVMLSFLSLVLAMPLSLIGPFFPGEAVRRGATLSAAGWILSMFPLTVLLLAPVFGRIVPRTGPKIIIIVGGCSLGVCTISFAFIDDLSGREFIVGATAIRILQGAASAASSTGSSALMAAVYPEDLGKISGTLEVCGCAGYMLGPFLGGLLFEYGGYRMPFFVVGSITLITMLLLNMAIPKRQAAALAPSSVTVLHVLCAPGVLMVIAASVTSMSVFSFLDLSLQPTLASHHLSTSSIGLVFVMISAVYAIASPIIGYVVTPANAHSFITGGMIVSCGALAALSAQHISIRIVSLAILSAGCAVVVVPVPPQMVSLTKHLGAGATDVMSGVLVASYSLGETIGPLVGGALMDWAGMRGAAPVLAVVVGIVAFVFSTTRLENYLRDPLLDSTSAVSLK